MKGFLEGLDFRLILLTSLGGAVFWLFDAVLDYWFETGRFTFTQNLLYDYPAHEMFIVRPIIFLFFIFFGFVLAFLVRKVKRNELVYTNLFDNINDAIFVTVTDEKGNLEFIDVNRRACSLFGYQKDELMKLPVPRVVAAEEYPKFVSGVLRQPNGGNSTPSEVTMIHKDGHKILSEVNTTDLTLWQRSTYLSVIRDITEIKKTANKLINSEQQLRVLTARLLEAQENERKRISAGLHDELGQALMHLKFKLSALIRNHDPGPKREDCDSVLHYMDQTIDYVRKLSRDLSPTVLEELGLTSALHYLIEEFSEHYELSWNSIHLDEIDGLFSSQAQVAIFRVFQETLTNVVRHARANEISVDVTREEGRVIFAVQDNGSGFETDEVLASGGAQAGIGIPSMQERMRMIGGSLEILSRKGEGTRVSFVVPVETRDVESVAV
jgi:PAS domain S-box-containing protein